MSDFARTSESFRTYERVVSQDLAIWMRRVAPMNNSRHTYERLIAHLPCCVYVCVSVCVVAAVCYIRTPYKCRPCKLAPWKRAQYQKTCTAFYHTRTPYQHLLSKPTPQQMEAFLATRGEEPVYSFPITDILKNATLVHLCLCVCVSVVLCVCVVRACLWACVWTQIIRAETRASNETSKPWSLGGGWKKFKKSQLYSHFTLQI